MIKIEVDSTTLVERNGVTAKGKAWSMREQSAYAHLLGEDGKAGKYPVRCKLTLEDNAPAYAVGYYTIDPRSVFVGDFDALGLARVRLMAVGQTAAKSIG